MTPDRNKKIELQGCNLTKIEKLEICIARRILEHINGCPIEELIQIAKIVVPECWETRLLEQELKNPTI